MGNINWMTVIVSVIMSAITVQMIIAINIRILNEILNKSRKDTIEACTDTVCEYVHKELDKR
jgi:hypothetical protein